MFCVFPVDSSDRWKVAPKSPIFQKTFFRLWREFSTFNLKRIEIKFDKFYSWLKSVFSLKMAFKLELQTQALLVTSIWLSC